MSDIQTAEDQFEGARQAAWKSMGDFATGKNAIESSQNYVEMNSAIPVPKEPAGLDIEENREQVLRDAADDLTKLRGEDRPDAKPIATREYTDTQTGKPIPPNESLSIEQSSWDLSGARQREQKAAELDEAAELSRVIDQLRSGDESPGVETAQPLPIEQAQPQPAEQPQDELQRALQNPAVLSAVQQAVAQEQAKTEYAFNQYANGLIQNGQVAAAALVPELANLQPHELSAGIQVVASRDPQRAQQILNYCERITPLVNQAVQAQQVQQQRQAAQYQAAFAQNSAQHDKAYDQWSKSQGTSPDEQKAIYREVVAGFRAQGWTDADIANAYNSNPAMRSLSGQILMHQAAAYRLGEKARQNAQRKIRHAIPHVQAPTSPVERQSDSVII